MGQGERDPIVRLWLLPSSSSHHLGQPRVAAEFRVRFGYHLVVEHERVCKW